VAVGACCAADGAEAFVAGVEFGCRCGCAKLLTQTAHVLATSAAQKINRNVRDAEGGLFMAARVYRERRVRRREERAGGRNGWVAWKGTLLGLAAEAGVTSAA
jgi:hypothetical protein